MASPQLHGRNAVVDASGTAVIAISGTTSGEINVIGSTLVGIFTPTALTSTSITFTVASTTGGTFVPVKDKSNSLYTINVDTAAANYYFIDPTIFAGSQFIKIVTASTEAAARTFTFSKRPIL